MLRAGWRRRPPSPWRLTTFALLVVLLLAAGPGIVALRQTAGAPLATGQVRTDRPNGLSARSDDLGPPRNSTGAGLQDDEAPEGLEVNTVSGSGHRVSVPVLMYHYIRINPHPGDRVGFNLSVTPQHFAQQMQLLHDAGAHAVTLADLDRALNGEFQLPPHPVVLTFDGGYDDFATE